MNEFTEEQIVELVTQFRILRFFEYKHLPPHLQLISAPFRDIAFNAAHNTKNSQETAAGLRKLLEAKDCFVRAAL